MSYWVAECYRNRSQNEQNQFQHPSKRHSGLNRSRRGWSGTGAGHWRCPVLRLFSCCHCSQVWLLCAHRKAVIWKNIEFCRKMHLVIDPKSNENWMQHRSNVEHQSYQNQAKIDEKICKIDKISFTGAILAQDKLEHRFYMILGRFEVPFWRSKIVEKFDPTIKLFVCIPRNFVFYDRRP